MIIQDFCCKSFSEIISIQEISIQKSKKGAYLKGSSKNLEGGSTITYLNQNLSESKSFKQRVTKKCNRPAKK